MNSRSVPAHRWVLIYDGECGFCRRQVERLRRWDTRRRVEAVPFQEIDVARYGVSRAAAEAAMHLVGPGGEVWRGAEAARQVLRTLPGGCFAVWIFSLPGVMFAAERVSRWVAARRHRFGCASVVCKRGAKGG